MSETVGAPPAYRVIYVGTGRRRAKWWKGGVLRSERERTWRIRLAGEMEEVCQEMAGQGLRLFTVVPVKSSEAFQGGWTEGAWLYFTSA